MSIENDLRELAGTYSTQLKSQINVSDKIPPSGNGVSVCYLFPQGANDDKHSA